MITETVRAVPRTVVTSYLRVARLPLAAAEKLADQQGNDTWPPTLAFESFEAGVQAALGSLLHDEELTEAGRLGQAKVAKLREAAQLRTLAEVERAQASEQQQERKAEIAEQRKETVQKARERKQAIDREAADRERKVEQEAARKAEDVRRQQAEAKRVTDRRERASRLQALQTESKALGAAEQAVKADETVSVIDNALEANRQDRKSG
jgi:colicin import membrane protein